MKLAWSLARNAATFATSSGRPYRPSGTRESICSESGPSAGFEIGIDRARLDHVDQDAARREVEGPATRQGLYGGLGCGVGGHAREHRPVARDAADDDHPATIGEMRQRRACARLHPGDVDAEGPIERRVFLLCQRHEARDAGIVDEDIEPAELACRLANRGHLLRPISGVGLQGRSPCGPPPSRARPLHRRHPCCPHK